MRAVESGPPETASRSALAELKPAKSVLVSAAETGAGRSAAVTLLFSVDLLFQRNLRTRIFAQDLPERGARGLLLAQEGERLAEPQEGIGRPRGRFVFGRHVEEGFGGVPILLPLEQAFPQPILRFRRHPVARELAQKGTESICRQRIVLAQHVARSEVVIILGTVRRRQRRELCSSPIAAGPARGRVSGIGARIGAHVGQIKRLAGAAAAHPRPLLHGDWLGARKS